MKGFRLWILFSWAAALFVAGNLFFHGGLFPASLNYDHFEELRLIALLFAMHAVSLTLVFSVLKRLVKEPPTPPPPKSQKKPKKKPTGLNHAQIKKKKKE